MRKLKIIVNNDIFTYDDSDSVFTTIYIDYQDKYFPNNQWTDFTDSLLSMWTYELLKNKDLRDVNFSLYFMDGPFRMDVFKDKNGQLTINFINARGDKEISESTITCNYYDFLVILYDSIKLFNYILYSNGMNNGRFEPAYKQTIISMRELKEVIKHRYNTL